MLSWDDFRFVKAIADRQTSLEAASDLAINQSTLMNELAKIEQKLGATLFARDGATLTPTALGARMTQTAAAMAGAAAGFDHAAHAPQAKAMTFGLLRKDEVMTHSGLSFLSAMVAGEVPQPPIGATLGFHLAEVKEGYARFDGMPERRHYNPIGTVHGGFAATLLDSALGCAIFTTLEKGEAWTTLELKLNMVRPISEDTGVVRAEGHVIHRGRTIATSDGTLKDSAGKLYAHATTTCMIFPANILPAKTSPAKTSPAKILPANPG
jgi:uncharacterized protein (TIGR00369 family)